MKIIFVLSLMTSLNFAQANSDIQCWGNNTDQQLNVPDTLKGHRLEGTVKAVSLLEGSTCVVDPNGRVNCWGKNSKMTDIIASLTDVKNIVFGERDEEGYSVYCADTVTGFKCGDLAVDGSVPITATSLSLGLSHICYIEKGLPVCIDDHVTPFKIDKLKNIKKLTVISHDICVLGDAGVQCLDDDNSDFNISGQVPELNHPTDLFMTFAYACAVDKTGVHCWGSPDNDDLPPIPQIPAPKFPTQYVGGRSHVCGLSKEGVHCWGDNTFGQLNVPILKNPKSISSNYASNHTCVMDDTGPVCWGADSFGESSFAPFTALSAGLGNTCVLSGGQIQCWGSGSAKINQGIQDSQTKKDLNAISQIGVGPNYACVIDEVSSAPHSCFGDNDSLIQKSPSLPFDNETSFLSVGFSHFCYSFSSVMICMGADDFGQSSSPKDLNLKVMAQTFATGGRHTCAIDSDLGVRCWGANDQGQLQIPSGLKNPRNITSGYNHNCVLDDTGVHCWGSNEEGQTNVPKLKNPKLVQAGGYHTCALDDDGVHCWGDNSFGQTNVPATLGKNISQLSTGYLHSCAVVK